MHADLDRCVRARARCAQLRPDRFSLFIAVGIISLNNLLIHMPALHEL